MLVWPAWGTVPFYLTWISLTLLYGMRVWPIGPTLLVLVATLMLTGLPHIDQVIDGHHAAEQAGPGAADGAAVPDRRLARAAPGGGAADRRGARRAEPLDARRQERFIHDASHELRTPVTIARGHLELARATGGETVPSSTWPSMSWRGSTRSIERLLLSPTADQTDFVLTPRDRPRVVPRGRVHALVGGGSPSLAARAARRRAPARRSRPAADGARRAARERRQVHAPRATRSSCARGRMEPEHVRIEVEDEGCGVRQEALERIFDRFARADAGPDRGRPAASGSGWRSSTRSPRRHGGTLHGAEHRARLDLRAAAAGVRAAPEPLSGARAAWNR